MNGDSYRPAQSSASYRLTLDKLDDFYAARYSKRPPLQWQTFKPPLSKLTGAIRY